MKHGNIRVLCALVSVVMLLSALSVFCLPASALTVDETGTAIVYVKDGGTGDGTTAETPVGTISDAITSINGTKAATKGKIVLVGDVTVELATYDTKATVYTVPITITSANESEKATFILHNAVTSDRYYWLGGDTAFETVNLAALNGSVYINANGKSLTIGKAGVENDVTVLSGDTYKNISLIGGTGKDVSAPKIVLNSGSYANIFPTLGAGGGSMNGNSYLEIQSGVSVKYLQLAPTNKASVMNGNADIILNGCSVPNIYLANLSTPKALCTFNGYVSVKVNAGNKATIDKRIADAQFYTEEPATGNFGVYFAKGLTFDFSGFKGEASEYQAWADELGSNKVTSINVVSYYSVNFCGTQTSYKTGDEQYSVRFVAGLRNLDYQAVGFEIVAKDADGNFLHTYRKDTTIVYNTILASDETGVQQKINADDIGGNFIIALTISKIPVSQGKVIFEVTPYTIAGGVETRGMTTTVAYDSGNYSN